MKWIRWQVQITRKGTSGGYEAIITTVRLFRRKGNAKAAADYFRSRASTLDVRVTKRTFSSKGGYSEPIAVEDVWRRR